MKVLLKEKSLIIQLFLYWSMSSMDFMGLTLYMVKLELGKLTQWEC